LIPRRAALALVVMAACAQGPRVPPPATWEYRVDVAPNRHAVQVLATFDRAGTPTLAIDDVAAPLVRDLVVWDGTEWIAPAGAGESWSEPGCVTACSVRYTLDLDAMAASCDDAIDCALRARGATLSPALAWLMHPAPKGHADVTVRVRADPQSFSSGLRSAGEPGVFRFTSPELDEGSFTAFGPQRRLRVDVAGAAIDVVLLGAGERVFTMSDADLARFVGDAARCVARFYGRFPVAHATVYVVPVHGADEVLFGKVLALAGASVALLTGEEMPASRARDEWVVVHELFHLGFPSVRGEGRWLGEGLATYYEPLLRARDGWIDDTRLWTDLARSLPRGLPRPGLALGLDARNDLDSAYWGGALFALTADVTIRERTHGKKSLDDALRAILAHGGDAEHVWTVADVVRAGDEATGTTVLREMHARHVVGAEPLEVGRLLASLGVVKRADGGVTLRDDAPRSAIRKALTRP
jgi:hypothetical protein